MAVGLLTVPTTTDAASVNVDPDSRAVAIAAAPGEVNAGHLDVQIDADDYVVTFSDSTPPQAGAGCVEDAGQISCIVNGGDPITIEVRLGDENDHLDAISNPGAPVTLRAFLGDGDDEAVLGPGGAICGGFVCYVRGGSGGDEMVGGDDINYLFGGDGDDEVIAGNAAGNVLTGRGGDDKVRGGPGLDFMGRKEAGDDLLYGGGGDDVIHEQAGSDTIEAGAGDDQILATIERRGAPDLVDGGPGIDYYDRRCGACNISLDGKANDGERHQREDNVSAEWISTNARPVNHEAPGPQRYGPGTDRIVGDERPNLIASDDGRDFLSGKGGADRLVSGAGADTIRAVDGRSDKQIDCGAGEDRAIVDPQDRLIVRKNCEVVVVR